MPNTAPEHPHRLHVAVGVIVNHRQQLLIARRPQHLHQGGLWEFPGGKVEAGEDVQSALSRELEEELAITSAPEKMRPMMEIAHSYTDKSVLLDVWWVTQFAGRPHGREGQEIRWVHHSELPGYAFPAANTAIVDRILRVLTLEADQQRQI